MPVVLSELWKYLYGFAWKINSAILRPPTPRSSSCTLLLPAALVQAGEAGCLVKALI